MQFNLPEEEYEFLIDNSEEKISNVISKAEKKDGVTSFFANADRLLAFIHDAVFLYGMDDEYMPTEIGRRLYKIYDEILFQTKRKKDGTDK